MRDTAAWFLGLLLALTPGLAADVARAADPLARFHARLADLEAGRAEHLHVLQIGDSHTAGDHFTGRLRALLQERFGNGGRGFLPPGVPHAHYRPHLVAVTQSGGWSLKTSNKSPPDPLPFGLAGIVMQARDRASMSIHDRAGTETAWIEVHFLPRPDGGSLEALVDGEPHARFDTRQHSPALVRLEGRGRRLELRTLGDGPVDVTALRQVARDRGVVLSNLGFIGAQVSILGRWHWPSVRTDIAALDPALIILAFGTNEGFGTVERIEQGYAREFERRLTALEEAAPGASIVIVGPPDANRYPRYCLPPPRIVWEKDEKNGSNGRPPAAESQGERRPREDPGAQTPSTPPASPSTAAPEATPARPATSEPGAPSATGAAADVTATPPPPAAQPDAAPAAAPRAPDARPGYRRVLVWPDPPADARCRPLEADERGGYDALIEAKDRRLCRWHTPAAMAPVRRIQQDVARRHGVLFFDWSQLFEGECGADRWARRGLAHKDRVHFKPEGYALAADRLHAALLAGYGKAR